MKQLLIVLFLALAFAMTACAAGDDAARGPQEVIITASDIAYDTSRIEVTANQPVKLSLRNDGALEHDFSIMHIPAEMTSEQEDEEDDGHDMSHMEEMPELHVSAMPGESHTLSFTPTEPGEYTYFCSVLGHQDAGMSGSLVVAGP